VSLRSLTVATINSVTPLKVLSEEGIAAAQLHGKLTVKERGSHFGSFLSGECTVLVFGTEICTRG
jgi:superfamily II DNA/RNA helicase